MNMNELIKINSLNYGDVPTVSGRELHKALEVETRYNDWFARMCEYGFVEGEDFYSFLSKSTGGRPSTDHQLTIDTAKEICMLQRTEIGRTIRKYFIETEKQYKQKSDSSALLQYVQSLESRIATLESKQTKSRKLVIPDEEDNEIKIVLDFIDECCMKRINNSNRDGITTKALYDFFVKWCYQVRNVTPPKKTDFIKGVCKFFGVSYKHKDKTRRRAHGTRYYLITLRPEYINK